MGYGRRGRRPSEIPAAELKEIRRKERAGRTKAKMKDAGANAEVIKKMLADDLDRPLRKQDMMMIEADERRRQFLFYFHKYQGNIAAACQMVGISRSTFNKWLKNNLEIQQQVTEVTEAMLDIAEQQLLKNIEKGKEQSLFFFLCNKGKHRGWQDVRRLSAPQLQGIKIEIVHPGEPKRLPHVNIKTIESKVVESNGSTG